MSKQKMMGCPSCGAEIPVREETCPYCGAVNAYASETKYQRDLEGLTREVNQRPEKDKKARIFHEIRHQLLLIIGTICIFLVVLGILYLITHWMNAQDLENLRSLVSHGL